MADYLGSNQTRVLDAENRNFESVIFQKRKPPLSCEWNLIGELQQNRDQELVKSVIPSGWTVVGQVRENTSEDCCLVGDVLTSPSLPANSIKLIAKNRGKETFKNIAFVNGWKVLVQGSSATDENNLIKLAPPSDLVSRVDFVFLEVWKKLVTTTDPIYKYGNVLYGGTNYTNDLIDPYIGKETALRMQIQYRIRVIPGTISGMGIDLDTYPEGFNTSTVVAQGAASSPLTNYSCSIFRPVAGDPGLWQAGLGGNTSIPDPGTPSDSQVLLGTADGYSYGIPMFAIFRRKIGSYQPVSAPLSCKNSLANYLGGVSSDRPDNTYYDWIVPADIIDMRHRVMISGENMKEICEEAFDKLVANKLVTKSGKALFPVGQWGSELVQADSVEDGNDLANTEEITSSTPDGHRRIFSNAGLTQKRTLIKKTTTDKTPSGGNWATSDYYDITLTSYPSGSVISAIKQVYIQSSPLTPVTYTASGIGSATVTITLTSNPATTSPLITEYSITYPTGSFGLHEVPTEFLEVRPESDMLHPIATEDQDIRVRDSSAVAIIAPFTGSKYNTLRNRGGSTTDPHDFGHQMIYHVIGGGTTTVTVDRTTDGYDVLGINNARLVTGASTYSALTISSIIRDATKYYVTFSTVIPAGQAVELTLYLGTHFFTMNKQGRAITESYEMMELTGTAISSTVYRIDSTDKPLLAVAAYSDGIAFGYVDGTAKNLTLDTSSKLPALTAMGICDVTFSAAVVGSPTVTIPVMALSAIEPLENYSFFYKYTPYQGLLDSSTFGNILATGSAITTTAGSGAITDASYTDGSVTVVMNSVYVYGHDTTWADKIASGDYLTLGTDTLNREYKIASIPNNSALTLERPIESASGDYTYSIFSKDRPYFNQPNVIDRLPILKADYETLGNSEPIGFSNSDDYPVLQNSVINKTQDITLQGPYDFTVGVNTVDMSFSEGRGRTTVAIDPILAPKGQHTLGLAFQTLFPTANYKRSYQSYIINKNVDGTSGKIYMMVVGGESDTSGYNCYLNEKATTDVVDLFELPGRPIIAE